VWGQRWRFNNDVFLTSFFYKKKSGSQSAQKDFMPRKRFAPDDVGIVRTLAVCKTCHCSSQPPFSEVPFHHKILLNDFTSFIAIFEVSIHLLIKFSLFRSWRWPHPTFFLCLSDHVPYFLSTSYFLFLSEPHMYLTEREHQVIEPQWAEVICSMSRATFLASSCCVTVRQPKTEASSW